jgi:LPXTG-site transpeptidase (sortase) family protein
MESEKRFAKLHRHINDILSIFIILFSLYILISPLVPIVTLWITKANDKTGGYVYQTKLQTKPKIVQVAKKIPEDNRLVLPTIELNDQILEGSDFRTLDRGLWRKPSTSTPDKGGNTVIAGHRFMYGNNNSFYHLDLIKLGDKFPVYWQSKEYDYEVVKIEVVSALATEVEQNTDEPILTLYTCTPLWLPTQRLVVISHLITEANK